MINCFRIWKQSKFLKKKKNFLKFPFILMINHTNLGIIFELKIQVIQILHA